jgi:glycosyltransferase involved in cell wall biosynthesis
MNEEKCPLISCIVPARNEGGHLEKLIIQILSIPTIAEVIIVEGGSSDDTWEIAQQLERKFVKKVRTLQQTGKGKFNAVLDGAACASGKLILIWDADGTVSSSDTEKIIHLSLQTSGPVIGNRLRGNIAPGAMQKANWLGNWIFAFLWAPILGDSPADMLCGTKIFEAETFTKLPTWLRNADPYGDFALVAFARVQNRKVRTVPVDYSARTYGTTNIHRWSGGCALLLCTMKIYIWMLFQRKQLNK